MMKRRHKFFTLVEVVAAMAILTLGLAGFFSMSFMAQKRLYKAQMKWEQFHMLSEAGIIRDIKSFAVMRMWRICLRNSPVFPDRLC